MSENTPQSNDPDYIEETVVDGAAPAMTPTEALNAQLDSVDLDAPETTDEAKAPAVEVPPNKPQQVLQSAEVFDHSRKFNEEKITVTIPAEYSDRLQKLIQGSPNMNLADTDETVDWAKVMVDGQRLESFGGAYRRTVENPDAYFEQEVRTEGGTSLRPSLPSFNSTGGESLKGERGVLRLTTHLGLGGLHRFPLWNTGIWITLKPPSEAALLELNRINATDKITLGRNSYGLALSNTGSYMAERLVNFALEHLYQTNYKGEEDLRDVISAHDIPTLVWGIACAIYPEGFQYKRSCTHNIEKCQHVEKATLRLNKLLWTNTRGVTKWQIGHMSKLQQGSIDAAGVKRYKEELMASQSRDVSVTSDNEKKISFTLKTPTVRQYVDAGHRWLTDITTMINRSLAVDATDGERDRYIQEVGRATAMRQYLHWVENMRFGGDADDNSDASPIEDIDTLEKTFDVLSADDSVREGFMDQIAKYIDDSTITVVGVPEYTCPVCGGDNTAPKPVPRLTSIIPIDVNQTFFTLLVQKIEKIRVRQ